MDSGPPALGETLSADEIVALGDEIFAESEALPYTDPAELPTTSQAVYRGAIGIGTIEDGPGTLPPSLVGQLAVGVDFSDSEIIGQAGNFRGPEDQAYDGTLAITNGMIFSDANLEDEYTYLADIAGTLTNAGNHVEVEGELLGDFYGEDHAYTGGHVEGVIQGSDGSPFQLDGGFIAER